MSPNESCRCVSTLGDWSTLQSVIDAETDGEAAKLLPGCSCQQYLRCTAGLVAMLSITFEHATAQPLTLSPEQICGRTCNCPGI